MGGASFLIQLVYPLPEGNPAHNIWHIGKKIGLDLGRVGTLVEISYITMLNLIYDVHTGHNNV
jgi:hypothetical protein